MPQPASHRPLARFVPAPTSSPHLIDPERRRWMKAAAAVVGSAVLPAGVRRSIAAESEAAAPAPGGASVSTQPALRFSEKTDLLVLTDRPPNLETPLNWFAHDYTPNEAFFVRWHLGVVPTSIDTRTFRLKVSGHVEQTISYSLAELKSQFEPVSVVAVNQCSGNGRALFEPRVAGGQWLNGAMGNAKWTGVRLKALLDKAGIKRGAVDVTFGGLDRAPLPGVAPFIKSLPVEHEKVGQTVLAYAMNDQPLPMLNGFPLRAVVPGWYATYWVKALNEITVTDNPFDGFWMAKAYRVPRTPNLVEAPDRLATETEPIGPMTCRSLIVTPAADGRLAAGRPCEISGVAVDSGQGITSVEVSTDQGKHWSAARLDPELGPFAWRRFRFDWTPTAGSHVLLSRATNRAGETQTTEQWNRSGYGRNVIEPVAVNAV